MSPEDLKRAQTFVEAHLSLTKKEAKVLSKIKVVPDPDLPETFLGHTSAASQTIRISPSLLTPENKSRLLGTLVHELIHQMYYKLKPEETDFFLEGSALLGEFLFLQQEFGKKEAYLSFLPIVGEAVTSPDENLEAFEVSARDYGTAFLYFLFVSENFGTQEFPKRHLRARSSGTSGIEEALEHSTLPKAWRELPTFEARFRTSLLKKRNTLSLRVNDRFQQLMSVLED